MSNEAAQRTTTHDYSSVPNTANDWRCKCGWFGNHGWQGYALHLEDALAPRPNAAVLRQAIRRVMDADPAVWLEQGDMADAAASEYNRILDEIGSAR